MANPTRPEFDILDSEGLEYHRWVSDVETAFVAKDYTATITDPKDDELSNKVKANALMFLRRHIDPSLRWEYLQLKTPKELWDALKGRFGNIHDTLLPELAVQWNGIRLLDYKRVNDFNKDMLRFKARLNFCGREITEDNMIYKTLTTFPTSAFILANQYKLEYDNKRITTFNKLISLLQVAERHNEVLLNNNARPEANYEKMKGGKNSMQRGLDVLIPTHVATMHHVERDVEVVETRDFSERDVLSLEDKLDIYLNEMRSNSEFSQLKGIGSLAKKLVETGKHKTHAAVYKLLTLALVLPVATASVEKVFSAMNIVKNPLRNRMGDQWVNDSLLVYIEKDIFNSIGNDAIMQRFQNMRSRRGQLPSR
ncbi:uncharacterized protein LOC133732705 [Rosa rugosa]|uniref:uncharacterized protein LOC133732705 n=1 Tax=Rosa rugosa TaxID=74645 RepID=UPI002B40A61D|nr:uncharacterized protein LOC133732705 [Rosa rugosa]